MYFNRCISIKVFRLSKQKHLLVGIENNNINNKIFGAYSDWFGNISEISGEKKERNTFTFFLYVVSVDTAIEWIMDLNRSLTNSQIYDGEFFEVVGNEGDILIVRYVFLMEIIKIKWKYAIWRGFF